MSGKPSIDTLIARRIRTLLTDGFEPLTEAGRLDALKTSIAWQKAQRKSAPATPEDQFGWIKHLADDEDDVDPVASDAR